MFTMWSILLAVPLTAITKTGKNEFEACWEAALSTKMNVVAFVAPAHRGRDITSQVELESVGSNV